MWTLLFCFSTQTVYERALELMIGAVFSLDMSENSPNVHQSAAGRLHTSSFKVQNPKTPSL